MTYVVNDRCYVVLLTYVVSDLNREEITGIFMKKIAKN